MRHMRLQFLIWKLVAIAVIMGMILADRSNTALTPECRDCRINWPRTRPQGMRASERDPAELDQSDWNAVHPPTFEAPPSRRPSKPRRGRPSSPARSER